MKTLLADSMNNDGTKWSTSIELSKSSGTTVTLYTSNNFIDTNIELEIDAQTANPIFDGGNLNSKSASAVFTNASTSSSDSSGISVLAKGAAGRDAVLYNGAVNGWVNKGDDAEALNSISQSEWNGNNYYITGVTLDNGKYFDVTIPDGNSDPITYRFSADSNGNTTISSPTSVFLVNGESYDITVPNGASGTITYHFLVDSNGNTTIT